MRIHVRLALLLVGDAAALVWSARTCPAAWRILGEVGRQRTGVDQLGGALATLLVAALAGYLALVLLVSGLAELPGVAGRCGRWLCAAVVPAALRRLIAGVAGLGIAVAFAAAETRAASADPPPSTAAVLPAPAWPTDGALPPPHWPVQQQAQRTHRQTVSSAAADRRNKYVRVRPGDSLWVIASRSLGGAASPGRVAREWPRWWAANREVIGADPNLLRPGQLLTAPLGKKGTG